MVVKIKSFLGTTWVRIKNFMHSAILWFSKFIFWILANVVTILLPLLCIVIILRLAKYPVEWLQFFPDCVLIGYSLCCCLVISLVNSSTLFRGMVKGCFILFTVILGVACIVVYTALAIPSYGLLIEHFELDKAFAWIVVKVLGIVLGVLVVIVAGIQATPPRKQSVQPNNGNP